MPVAAFDTLKFARQLKQAGIPDQHAEAQAAALIEALHSGTQELATQRDVEKLHQHVRSDIQEVRHQLEQHRQESKQSFEQVRQEIKQVEQRLDAKIDQLDAKFDAKIDQVATSIRGDIALLRWMFGATFAGIAAILVRLFFFRGSM